MLLFSKKLLPRLLIFTIILSLFFFKARDVRTNEVVAIKKMSYSGKQSTEVSEIFTFLFTC